MATRDANMNFSASIVAQASISGCVEAEFTSLAARSELGSRPNNRNVPAKQIWGAAKPRMRETAYKCGNTRDFGRLTYLWASWGWCKNFCSDLSSDSRELRRAQFAANLYVAYDSDDLGPRPAIGHLAS